MHSETLKQPTKPYRPDFKSGLNTKIWLSEKVIIPQKQETLFMNKYGVEADFSASRPAALANKLCAGIFEKLADKLRYVLTFPPAIKIYNRKNLIDKGSAFNFCIPDTREVLDNDYPFPGRSIFFGKFQNLREIDDITEFQYKNKKTSSPHFLAPFIHEWLHSFQLDYIYNKFGYGGNCDYLKEIYPDKNKKVTGYKLLEGLEKKKLTDIENEIIFNELGEYSTLPKNQYIEIFSEAFTEFICNSLQGVNIVKNPIEEFYKTNKEFQNIIHKVCRFE